MDMSPTKLYGFLYDRHISVVWPGVRRRPAGGGSRQSWCAARAATSPAHVHAPNTVPTSSSTSAVIAVLLVPFSTHYTLSDFFM